MQATALVLAPERDRERKIAGLTLGERARRVAVRHGIAEARVHVVRDGTELDQVADALAGEPLLLIRATGWVVAPQLVADLDIESPEPRKAVTADGDYAGACWSGTAENTAALLSALRDDFDAGERQATTNWPGSEVGDRARHPARTRDEARAASRWQFQAVHKNHDSWIDTYLYRVPAAPLVRLLLHTPVTPNAISVFSLLLSLVGCTLAAQPSPRMHALGLAIVVFGAIVDACDGAIARLTLQGSNFGAWLDAIGDDIERLALITAVGIHVSRLYPDIPIMWLTAGTLALTLTSMVLIYWYCIVIAGSSSNRDYETVLGVGSEIEVDDQGRSLKRLIGDMGATMARRVFIDPAVLLLALLGLPLVSFIGLGIGSVVAIGLILPAHIRMVRARRSGATPS